MIKKLLIGYYFIAAIYLFSFWSELGINIFEYINLESSLLLPLQVLFEKATSSVIMIIILIYLFSDYFLAKGPGVFSEEEIKKRKKLTREMQVLIIIIAIFGKFLVPTKINDMEYLELLAYIFLFFVHITWGEKIFLYLKDSFKITYYELLFVSSLLPIAVCLFFIGKRDAVTSISDKNTVKVKINYSEYNYVGKLGDSIFLYDTKEKKITQLNKIPDNFKRTF